MNVKEALSELRETVDIDDASVPMVQSYARALGEQLIGANETEKLLHFIELMLDDGFIPMTTPFVWPPCEPWPETTKAAILDRFSREFSSLPHAATFLDICWFSRADSIALSQAAARKNWKRE